MPRKNSFWGFDFSENAHLAQASNRGTFSMCPMFDNYTNWQLDAYLRAETRFNGSYDVCAIRWLKGFNELNNLP